MPTAIFIGNYFEGAYPEPEPPPQPPQPPQPLKFYMPFVSNAEEATDLFEPITARMGTLYFYADGQRIAMKKDGVVSYIYGDQLGSVSAVADGNGNLISETLYHPWGTTRYAQGASPTDYGYTGQMKEGDIYFYNARWYDPQLGRFMQADTFVPTAQGIQAWDRFAYVNNNPMRYSDPSGQYICDSNGNCFVNGFVEAEGISQEIGKSTCWAVADAMQINIILGETKTVEDMLTIFPAYHKPSIFVAGGIGTTLSEQAHILPMVFGDRLDYEIKEYSKEAVFENLFNDRPVILQIPLPGIKFGHDVLAVGFNENTNSLIFWNWGRWVDEAGLLYDLSGIVKSKSINDLMSYPHQPFVPPNQMLVAYRRINTGSYFQWPKDRQAGRNLQLME